MNLSPRRKSRLTRKSAYFFDSFQWSEILQFIRKSIHRLRNFDPLPHLQTYLRLLSWTSLALAILIIEFGIGIGSSFIQLRQQVEQIQKTLLAVSLDNASNVSAITTSLENTQNLLTALFVIAVLIFLALCINTLLIAWADYRTNRELRRLQKEWHEKGIKTGILKTTEALDLDPSVLRNIMSWLYDYGHDNKDADTAFDLFTQLIARFSFLNFHPVGEIGEQVSFDPRIHRNTEVDIHLGDIGYIYETGWMLDDEIIRKPLVTRRPL
jgi:hypothetical protein